MTIEMEEKAVRRGRHLARLSGLSHGLILLAFLLPFYSFTCEGPAPEGKAPVTDVHLLSGYKIIQEYVPSASLDENLSWSTMPILIVFKFFSLVPMLAALGAFVALLASDSKQAKETGVLGVRVSCALGLGSFLLLVVNGFLWGQSWSDLHSRIGWVLAVALSLLASLLSAASLFFMTVRPGLKKAGLPTAPG